MAPPLPTLLVAVVVVIFFAILFLFLGKKRDEKINRLPPGPRRLPLIGNLHQLDPRAPHVSLHRLSTIHGPIMHLQLGSVPTIVVSSADVAREVFKTHDIAFSGRPRLYAARKFSYGCRDMVFSPYGELWRQVRRVAVLELLSARKVQSFRGVREEEVAALVQSIASAPPAAPVNLSEMTLRLVNDVTCRVAFGRKYSHRRVKEVLLETQALLGGFCVADFFPGIEWVEGFTGLKGRLDRNFQELDGLYDRVIDDHLQQEQKRRDQSGNEDLVGVLLRLRHDRLYEDVFGSMDGIKGLLTDIFIAGTDTSAASLVWTMTELLRSPKTMEKVQQEVRNSIGKQKLEVAEADLPKLHYLKLVIKESLRLHPPAPLLVPRETIETTKIQDYVIPARTRVFVNAKTIGRDPNYWERPEEFFPERFLGDHYKNVDYTGHDFQFVPFGAGRRICPGMSFSVVIVELVLANLLFRFDWEYCGEELDVEEAFGITMHKKSPLWVVATPVV